MNSKEAIFRRVHKPNNTPYCIMLICTMLILSFLFLIQQNSVWFVIVSGIGSGGIASILVAWLIDFSNCRMLNLRDAKIRFFYFDSMFFAITNLLEIPPCYSNEEEQTERRWYEWFDAMMKSDIELTENDVKGIIETIECAEEEIQTVLDRKLEIMVEGILSEIEIDNITFLKSELGTYKLMLKTQGWSKKLPYNTTNDIKKYIEGTRLLSFLNHEKYSRYETIDFHEKFKKHFIN